MEDTPIVAGLAGGGLSDAGGNDLGCYGEDAGHLEREDTGDDHEEGAYAQHEGQ